jgi:hypothetical protein
MLYSALSKPVAQCVSRVHRATRACHPDQRCKRGIG